MANFAVTISLVTASALAAIYSSDTNLRMLSVDADFSPNLVLSDGSKRPWVVNPMGIERDFPAWAIAYAILPANVDAEYSIFCRVWVPVCTLPFLHCYSRV